LRESKPLRGFDFSEFEGKPLGGLPSNSRDNRTHCVQLPAAETRGRIIPPSPSKEHRQPHNVELPPGYSVIQKSKTTDKFSPYKPKKASVTDKFILPPR
jgi:hypothetical protein